MKIRQALLFLLLAVLVIVGLLVRELFFASGHTPAITDGKGAVIPGSVASLERIRLGGVAQWVLIRGRDARKPILLFLHGGPGMPTMYLAHAFQSDLERDFVIVHWDRRGAGKSYRCRFAIETLNVRQMLRDTYELTQILCRRFDQEKILLVGHSWGTYLGMLAIHEHPEYYAAYVGMGQITGDTTRVRALQREFLIRQAREAGDLTLVAELTGENPGIREDDLFRYGAELHMSRNLWPLIVTGLRAPEYTLGEGLDMKRGAELVRAHMTYNVTSEPLESCITRVEIPVFFFLGRYDYTTPSALAEEYLRKLEAPFKKLVWFEHSAHFPFFEEPERFCLEMLEVWNLLQRQSEQIGANPESVAQR